LLELAFPVTAVALSWLGFVLRLAFAILRERFTDVNDVFETTLLVPPYKAFVGSGIDQFTLSACHLQLQA
jgi:hypothetical protein